MALDCYMGVPPTSLHYPQLQLQVPSSCSMLRKRLERQLVPNSAKVPEHKRFFPIAKLDNVITKHLVRDVLRCSCLDCSEHRQLSRMNDVWHWSNKILGDNQNSFEDVKTLFAILAFIEAPNLITFFLEKQVTDKELLAEPYTFTAEYFGQVVTSKSCQHLAIKFHWAKFKFLVPYMMHGDFDVYPEGTILPFANEIMLGRETENGEIVSEGSFGKVFSFELVDGYGEFPEFPGVKHFARKELLLSNTKKFQYELKNLMFVKKLQDDHLIKIVKPYQHGDRYNLIFPLAVTNLGEYLRSSKYHPYSSATSLIRHPVWHQVLGLARGLHRVLNFEDPESLAAEPMFGYHFDLKPANILVDNSERLVITDFGQSHFKSALNATSSRVRGRGGTEAYAPPELDKEEPWGNRKYDIWSLGCVFLEIAVFVVDGRNGVRGLDQARISPVHGTFHRDDRFFQPKAQTNTYELKPQVSHQITTLLSKTNSEVDKDFLRQFLALVLAMLRIEPMRRLSSDDVCVRLSRMLQYPSTPSTGSASCSDAITQYPKAFSSHTVPGSEFGADLMRSFQPISYDIDRYPQRGHIRFFVNEGQLEVQSSDPTGTRQIFSGERSSFRLIPEYAFRCQTVGRFGDAIICMMRNAPLPGATQRCVFNFGKDIRAVAALQEVLIGQHAVISGKIKTVSLSFKQKNKRTKQWSNGGRAQKRASAIQLWRETSYRDIAEVTARKDHSVKRASQLVEHPTQPAHRRIVIYLDDNILSMRLGKNQRMDSRSTTDGSTSVITFVPTDKHADKSYQVSLLHSSSSTSRPFLPMSTAEIEALEDANCVECVSMTIEFYMPEEANTFCNKYLKEKKQWSQEMKRSDVLQVRKDFDFGYTRRTNESKSTL